MTTQPQDHFSHNSTSTTACTQGMSNFDTMSVLVSDPQSGMCMACAMQGEAGAGMQQSKRLQRQPGRLHCCRMRIWSQAHGKTTDPSALEVGIQL